MATLIDHIPSQYNDSPRDSLVAAMRIASLVEPWPALEEHGCSGEARPDAPAGEEMLRDVAVLVGTYGGRVVYRETRDPQPGDPDDARPVGVGLVAVWDRGFLDVSVGTSGNRGVQVSAMSCDPRPLALVAILRRRLTQPRRRPAPGTLYVIQRQRGGVCGLGTLETEPCPLERRNYAPALVAAYDRVLADCRATRPRGRLVLFNGPPGTGKTYLVRGLLTDLPSAARVIVPSNLVCELAGPDLFDPLLEARRRHAADEPVVLVIEDGDEAVRRRGRETFGAVSSLLNLADGILGAALNLRVVVTTNTPAARLDRAALRKGRLSERIDVGPLPADLANAVFTRLTGKGCGLYARPVSIAQVYADARQHAPETRVPQIDGLSLSA